MRRRERQYLDPMSRRYFEAYPEQKRRVFVTITYFHGTGNHFHVEMREEPNYVYDEQSGSWVVPPAELEEADPDEARPDGHDTGRHRFMKFNSDKTARLWVERTFHEEFDPDTHELVFRGDVSRRWFYPEGD
jgi:hypothetical protein